MAITTGISHTGVFGVSLTYSLFVTVKVISNSFFFIISALVFKRALLLVNELEDDEHHEVPVLLQSAIHTVSLYFRK